MDADGRVLPAYPHTCLPTYLLTRARAHTRTHAIRAQDFIVWMRVAALPTFKKLLRTIPKGTLKRAANYSLIVLDNFPVEVRIPKPQDLNPTL